MPPGGDRCLSAACYAAGQPDNHWFGAIPSGGNDGLPRDGCAAGPAPDLRPRPSGSGTGDHSDAWVAGKLTPIRSSASLPVTTAAFDFLGWGSSDKPSGYPYTADNQVGDLDAVITQL